ncbi:MAG: FAD-dependent oxidoreductase [Myxococcales bacterium]|nr:FAD-dependent oxidoreductase [Myxococcales bacterium]
MRVVIIGNGVAGIEAALALRAREPAWSITIVSEESDHFFSRTALMWVLSGQLSHRCIEPHERDLYARMRFERVRARALGVDAALRQIRLAGRPPLDFDQLLIACGSRPRPGPWPGAELDGVGAFVSLQDLEWLEAELHGGPSRGGRPPNPDAHVALAPADSPYRPRTSLRARRGGPPRHPVVIGGGLIGIEAVEVMLAAGLRPRFYVREDSFWPVALDAREAAVVTEALRAHGADVRLGEHVEALVDDGQGAVGAVRSDAGEEPCDLCVVAIGVEPNTGWLVGSGVSLDARGGVVTSERLETSVEGIYAAGDCAAVRWFDGTTRPEPLWYTARAQGRVAARAMLGDSVRYDRGPWFNSAKLMDLEYTTAGLVNQHMEGEHNWFFEERREAGGALRSTLRVVLAGERVVGFNALGRRWNHAVWVRWIEERRPLGWVLDHLAEAAFDTELVPPLVIPREARERAPERPATRSNEAPVAAPRY